MWLFGKCNFSGPWTGYGTAVHGGEVSPWPHLGLGHNSPGQNGYLKYHGNIRQRLAIVEIVFDGRRLRGLTNSEYDDIDPIYLPDGHIVFTTTRGNTYVRCGPYIYSYVLARCDADGGNVYLISRNSEPDFVPSLLGDGRVIYSRWEYTDKDLMRIESLWTTNQEGVIPCHPWFCGGFG